MKKANDDLLFAVMNANSETEKGDFTGEQYREEQKENAATPSGQGGGGTGPIDPSRLPDRVMDAVENIEAGAKFLYLGTDNTYLYEDTGLTNKVSKERLLDLIKSGKPIYINALNRFYFVPVFYRVLQFVAVFAFDEAGEQLVYYTSEYEG